jgi:hypothetical protein
LPVIRVEHAKSDLYRIAAEEQSEQREQMFEIPVGAVEEPVV